VTFEGHFGDLRTLVTFTRDLLTIAKFLVVIFAVCSTVRHLNDCRFTAFARHRIRHLRRLDTFIHTSRLGSKNSR